VASENARGNVGAAKDVTERSQRKVSECREITTEGLNPHPRLRRECGTRKNKGNGGALGRDVEFAVGFDVAVGHAGGVEGGGGAAFAVEED
jgi:hypothetical protein